MNGIPATIVIRQLMATPTTQAAHRPHAVQSPRTHSTATRVVAPLLALALFVALAFVLVVSQTGSDDSTPEAACRIRAAYSQAHTCR